MPQLAIDTVFANSLTDRQKAAIRLVGENISLGVESAPIYTNGAKLYSVYDDPTLGAGDDAAYFGTIIKHIGEIPSGLDFDDEDREVARAAVIGWLDTFNVIKAADLDLDEDGDVLLQVIQANEPTGKILMFSSGLPSNWQPFTGI